MLSKHLLKVIQDRKGRPGVFHPPLENNHGISKNTKSHILQPASLQI